MAPSQQQQQQQQHQLRESTATAENFLTTTTTLSHHFMSNSTQISNNNNNNNSFQHFHTTCQKAKIQPVPVEEITGSTLLSAITAFSTPDNTPSPVSCKLNQGFQGSFHQRSSAGFTYVSLRAAFLCLHFRFVLY
jgi:hypothetical protein